MALEFEPFVDADAVAEFLSVKRKTVLEWARRGAIPAHAWGTGGRKVWRFLISEIASHAKPIQGTIDIGSPEIARLEKKYG
jgi:excisionase family DNA binding protein